VTVVELLAEPSLDNVPAVPGLRIGPKVVQALV
jgi:hypothetical protein